MTLKECCLFWVWVFSFVPKVERNISDCQLDARLQKSGVIFRKVFFFQGFAVCGVDEACFAVGTFQHLDNLVDVGVHQLHHTVQVVRDVYHVRDVNFWAD